VAGWDTKEASSQAGNQNCTIGEKKEWEVVLTGKANISQSSNDRLMPSNRRCELAKGQLVTRQTSGKSP